MNKQIDITNVVLTTTRLTLRPWRESDLNDIYEYASVDGVGQMAGWNPHRNLSCMTILLFFILLTGAEIVLCRMALKSVKRLQLMAYVNC